MKKRLAALLCFAMLVTSTFGPLNSVVLAEGEETSVSESSPETGGSESKEATPDDSQEKQEEASNEIAPTLPGGVLMA